MKEHGIEGVWLQRFLVRLEQPEMRDFRNRVLDNVRRAAEKHRLKFAIEYDLSMPDPKGALALLERDWRSLVDRGITKSPAYLHKDQLPALIIWGFGVAHQKKYRVVLGGSVPSRWRELIRDARPEVAWKDVYSSFDFLLPWTVGRYGNDAQADRWQSNMIQADLAYLTEVERRTGRAIGYIPIIWPGFSFGNKENTAAKFNSIPRRAGRFYWRQAYNIVQAGFRNVFIAMFDEVDEGTAIFKCVTNELATPASAQFPQRNRFLFLGAEEEQLSADYYLRLTRALSETLQGKRVIQAELPVLFQ